MKEAANGSTLTRPRTLIPLCIVLLVGCSDTGRTTEGGEDAARPGESTYAKFCIACHQLGLSGAPKLGDGAAWREPAARGMDAMLARVVEGIPPAMPPKGGCAQCSEEELRASIQYMIDQSLPADASRGP